MIKKILMILCIPHLLHAIHGGAGILPYAKDIKNGNIYFLLSTDFNRENKLTDFGGDGIHHTNFIEIAAQEGFEETMGVIMSKKQIKRRICRANKQKQYTSITIKNYSYTTYFIDITPYACDKILRDDLIKRLYAKLDYFYKKYKKANKKKYGTFCEKRKFIWLKESAFKNAIQGTYEKYILFEPFQKNVHQLDASFFNALR